MASVNSTRHRHRFIDISGQQFGLWTVLHEVSHPSGRTHWLCRCACGTERVVIGSRLRAGNSTCCGCRRNRPLGIVCGKKHGMSTTPEYFAWQQLRGRCENSARRDFHRYGGRGICVCERWQSFEAFLEDMGPRPSAQHSVERKDNDGNYEPGNCFWATKKEQARNRRACRMLTFNNTTRCLSEWAEVVGMNPVTLTARLRRGWLTRSCTLPDAPAEARKSPRECPLTDEMRVPHKLYLTSRRILPILRTTRRTNSQTVRR